MAKVFYIGDWAVSLGPIFAETPFNYAFKGLQTFRYDHYLKEAIESTAEHTCDTCPTWDFYGMPPGRWEEILASSQQSTRIRHLCAPTRQWQDGVTADASSTKRRLNTP